MGQERIIINNITEPQQFASTIQARIKLQFFIQNKQATAQIGTNSEELILIRNTCCTIQTHANMQMVELIVHLNEWVDFEQNTVNIKQVFTLTDTKVVLEF